MTHVSEGSHPDLAPDRKQRARTTTETTVGRAARPASLAFPLRPASSRGDRGPRALFRRVLGLPGTSDLR